MASPVAELRLRTSPAWRLVPVGALAPPLRDTLGASGEAWGVATSSQPGATAKLLDPDTAALLLGLDGAHPGVPAWAERRLGDGLPSLLRGLVLDGVVEVFAHDWVGGAAAAAALRLEIPEGADDPLVRLSRDAIRGVAALRRDAPSSAASLYAWNRLPMPTGWTEEVGGEPEAYAGWLGLDGRGLPPSLSRRWRRMGGGDLAAGWLGWRRIAGPRRRQEARFKLYVSPHPADLPRARILSARVLDDHAVPAFKVPGEARAALRPDSIVAYLEDEERVEQVGTALLGALTGVRSRGVPFTASVGGSSMVSAGIDPDEVSPAALPWVEERSWRWWVCTRLAAALASAEDDADASRARHALLRIQEEGVDVARWRPGPSLRERWRLSP